MSSVSTRAPLLLIVVLASTAVAVPSAPATHEPIVPVMEALAQNIVPGIRPGAWMDEPADCTFAFVVKDQQDRLYITSAGHCVGHVGQAVTMRDEGRIGTVVAFRDEGPSADWALIRILPEQYPDLDPTMIGWGGPTGVLDVTLPGPQTLKHYGWGSATWLDHSTRCRTALTNGAFWGQDTFTMYGTVLWGDSGSGTMTADGLAVGINTHLNVFVATGFSTGPRFSVVLDEMQDRTGLDLSLVEGRPVRETCEPDD